MYIISMIPILMGNLEFVGTKKILKERSIETQWKNL